MPESKFGQSGHKNMTFILPRNGGFRRKRKYLDQNCHEFCFLYTPKETCRQDLDNPSFSTTIMLECSHLINKTLFKLTQACLIHFYDGLTNRLSQ